MRLEDVSKAREKREVPSPTVPEFHHHAVNPEDPTVQVTHEQDLAQAAACEIERQIGQNLAWRNRRGPKEGC